MAHTKNPEWIGHYVCDALGIVDHHDALDRIPAEEPGQVTAPTQMNSGPHIRKFQTYRTVKDEWSGPACQWSGTLCPLMFAPEAPDVKNGS
jgi:hypothetical protein